MNGSTAKTEAICLAIHPWSRTSHVVSWLTPSGRVSTLVKGAVRPKSAFLGQYDLNYTCEIVYYSRARGELHALRECSPLERLDALRGDFRALALADYFRILARELAPSGPDCAEWFGMLSGALRGLARRERLRPGDLTGRLLEFEMDVLRATGLTPDLTQAADGAFQLRGERKIPVPAEVTRCLRRPRSEKNLKILLDAARVVGVFYAFHLDCASDVRRTVLGMISQSELKGVKAE